MKGRIVVQSLQKKRFHKRPLKKVERKHHSIYVKKSIKLYKESGSFGLFSAAPVILGQHNMESARKYLYRHVKAGGRKKLVVRLFPVFPEVRKPQEVRMGKGKGQKFVDYIQKVPSGKFLFGFRGRSIQILKMFKSKFGHAIKLARIKY